MRLAGVVCLSTGAVLVAAMGPHAGKGSGELSLNRRLEDVFHLGDAFLADALYCNYFLIARLQARGVDVMFEQHGARSHPPVATERLGLTSSGHVRYAPKTPYRDGTTHIVLEPLDFMARLAALVPPPRMHLTRYHGVFAAHSKLRAAITPAHRGTGASKPTTLAADSTKPPTPPHVARSWARRLKRVFGIEIEGCARCGGKLAIIASIEQPQLIAKILSPLEKTVPDQFQAELPLGARAPPLQVRLL